MVKKWGREMTRHTHSMLAALEDLTAVGFDAKMEIEIARYRLRQRQTGMTLEEAEAALLFTMKRLTKMMAILEQAWQEPYAYCRDEPENLERRGE